MKTLAGIALLSLVLCVVIPAHAEVTLLELEKSFYTNTEGFKFIGAQNETEQINLIIRDANGKFVGIMSDPVPDEGKFSITFNSVRELFSGAGIYNATAFTNSQQPEEGLTIQIEYDGSKIFQIQDYVLALKPIRDVTIDEEKTVSFTVGIMDGPIDGVVYSLENPPAGASIDSETGKFVWTPSSSHGNSPGAQYTFGIVATKANQSDRESITITVNDPALVPPESRQEPKTQPREEPEKPEPQPKQIAVPAPFVDEARDPQHYVDRYDSEPAYKEWFDKSYPEYDSIYHAVGLEEPPEIPAPFVDEARDPQHYVDRYDSEPAYKEWFDDNYPEYASIYEAVGLEEPEIKEVEFGECGEGTKLVDGVCTVIEPDEGGGCLIATATYGSEMAPQVQSLREIRDNQLMNTASGASFMTGFNQVYYSFSPYIADLQRENPAFREAVKIGITPLLSSLSVMSLAESDLEVLGYGIIVILLNVGVYLAAPAMLFYGIRKIRPVRF